MNGFDVLVLIVVAISALLAFARGFVREFLSLVALAAAILAALWGLPVLREPVRKIIQPGWIADFAIIVVLFLVVYVLVRVITGRIHEWVHDSEPLGMLDRAAGIIFGAARGFAIIGVLVLGITSIAKEEMLPKTMTKAKLYPFVYLTSQWLEKLAPDAFKSATRTANGAKRSGEGLAKIREENPEAFEKLIDSIDEKGKAAHTKKTDKNNSESSKKSKPDR